MKNYHDLVRRMFDAAVSAAQPEKALPGYLPPMPKGKTIVIGAGKASAQLARSLEKHWQGPISGMVVTRYGHGCPCKYIEVFEAGHPFPDQNSVTAAQKILELVRGLSPDDLVIGLFSGGGSATFSLPMDGVSLEDKIAITRQLFAAGASIQEINCVRTDLSAIKGGKLLDYISPAAVVTLAISDVPGDDPALIASGPTVSARAKLSLSSRQIVKKYDLHIPPHIMAILGKTHYRKPVDTLTQVISSPIQSLKIAAKIAENAGFTPLILSDCLEGEARDVAQVHGGIVRSIKNHGLPCKPPVAIISGGEVTVTGAVEGRIGGPNSEFMLALLLSLRHAGDYVALSGDTDGIDGNSMSAGAYADHETLAKAEESGLSAEEYLSRHNSQQFFSAIGHAVSPGPTGTNVNDFRVILVL